MAKLPKSINSPIDEAVFEIRFASKMQEELLVGAFTFALRDVILKIDPLPVLQLPIQIRNQDPNLWFVPTHTITLKEYDNIQISIGPRVLVFSNKNPYLGWKKWSEAMFPLLTKLLDTELIEGIQRTGLRYINIFQFPILSNINLKLDFPKRSTQNTFSSTRMEFEEDNFLLVLQVIDNARIIGAPSESPYSSVIDIDCINNTPMSIHDFRGNFISLMENSHEKEKDLFFSLLKDDFIESLNPQY